MRNTLIALTFFIVISITQVSAAIVFTPETGWSWNRLVLKATAAEQMAYCEKLEKEESYVSAVAHYRLLIRVFSSSPEAVESLYRIGEIKIKQKRWGSAQKYYENLLDLQITETSKLINSLNKKKRKKNYKPTESEKRELLDISFKTLQKQAQNGGSNPVLVLDVNRIFSSLYKIGEAYKNGARYKLFGVIPTWKQKTKFLAVYRYILTRSPNFEFSPQLQKEIALYLFGKKKYFEAKVEFDSLLFNYTLSDEAKDATYYIGLCHIKQSRGPAYNQENMDFAEARMKDYLLTYPSGEKAQASKDALTEIAESRAENSLIKIKFFVRRHQWKAAKMYIDEMENKYPTSKFTAEAKLIALHHEDINKQ